MFRINVLSPNVSYSSFQNQSKATIPPNLNAPCYYKEQMASFYQNQHA